MLGMGEGRHVSTQAKGRGREVDPQTDAQGQTRGGAENGPPQK